MEQKIKGSFAYKNWKISQLGKPSRLTFEHPLFADAQFIGEITEGLGPYQLINNLAFFSNRPALILRAQEYWEPETPQMNKTQDDYYHGGSEADELAALLSLCLGIPMKAGGATRVFGRDADPMGRPIGFNMTNNEDPILPLKRGRTILNTARKECPLEDAKVLSFFPLLSLENAMALVRAARLYQEAVWIIDATPELSWLMLTSAVETVAQQWGETGSSIERLVKYKPHLESILRKYAKEGEGDQLVFEVAQNLSGLIGATAKFVDFILEFLPPPPSSRPNEWAQLSWHKPNIKRVMNKVYDYRSKALHDGKPFPAPMCQPPDRVGENGEIAEIPVGLATGMKGGVWVAKDTPILLNTFEYIARNAILNRNYILDKPTLLDYD